MVQILIVSLNLLRRRWLKHKPTFSTGLFFIQKNKEIK